MTISASPLPIWNTITTAWDKVGGAKGSIWGAYLLSFLLIAGISIIAEILKHTSPVLGSLAKLVGQLVGSTMQVGLLYLGIQRARQLPIEAALIFRSLEPMMMLKVVVTYLLQGVLVFLPLFVLFFLCGILVGVLGGFFAYLLVGLLSLMIIPATMYYFARIAIAPGLVIDKSINPIAALKMAFAVSRGNGWRMVGLYFVLMAIVLAGIIPLMIPLIWIMPLTVISYGVMYVHLVESPRLS